LAPADRVLRRELHRIRRRWFRVVALSVGSKTTMAAAILLAAAAAADRWWHPSGGVLLGGCALVLLLAGAAAVLFSWPYRRRPDDRRVARFIEERCPEFDDAIVAAVDAASHGATTTLAPLVVEHAAARLTGLDASRVVSSEGLRSGVLRMGACAAAAVVAAVLAIPLAQRAAAELRIRYLPWSFAIEVRPGDARVRTGSPMTITARLNAHGRPLTGVVPELQLEAGGQTRVVPMLQRRDGYELRIDAVDRTFTYRVRAGRAMSAQYGVTALVPPRVEAIDLRYEYPSFTSLAPREEADGGDVYAPAGTRVRLRVRADKPIADARVALGAGSTALPAARVNNRTFETTLTLVRDGSYRASVVDADGLRGESVEYFIRLVADRPPEIHIVRPGGDQEITPLEEVTIEAKADDDFGIANMDMVFAVAGGSEHVVPFQTITGTSTARVGSRLIAAEDLGVKPGDVISYYARARDVPHAKASTLAQSEIYFLEVKPFNEEYSLADSSAMAAATGTELAGLIAAQKEVISATWNLRRRAGAGSSADDVRAVATAQAEVKTRTERAASSARPVRRGFGGEYFQFRPRQAPAGPPGSVAEAAAAMGRALEHLSAGATKDALPPEMAALNALLKAEAEIRQRQIAQQQNGSSSFGNGRQGQDLSNLFDRELKRQQRTNYETGSKVEEEPSQADAASALDRIKDLARRQEDLARRQQEANSLREEERRRELERLTREQEELRRQLEQAAKRQQQETGASGGRGQLQTSATAESAMRDALEQMRRASSDLRRNEPGSAAGRAAQAAEQLRQAEAQMQPGSAREGGTNGETRQLADALDALRQQRDRLTNLERRLADLQRAAKQQGQPAGQTGDGSRGERKGETGARSGQGKLDPSSGAGARAGDELQRTQEDYAREVQRARDLMGRLAQGGRETGRAAATPEEQQWSWGAPGTEAWKQDFSRWESLGTDAARALERAETTVARRLSKALERDRLRAGGSDRVPDAYADRVARYYESLARGGGGRK
jgi:hypothetical protein